MKKIIAVMCILACVAACITGCGKKEENDLKTRAVPEWTKASAMYEVNVRQYTKEGTFNAFSEHLEEIKELGVSVLWFMPIHPISVTKRSGVLGSYYSITDYCEVNPEFGNKDDFKKLVDKAHEMGFKVMLDWVANHTGWDCAWIKEHPDWYTQDDKGSIVSPVGMGWPDVADLNYDSSDMRKEMIKCMKYWVEEFDVDGFRCDYADGVPVDFWEDARKELEKVKPVFMLAEEDKKKEYLEYAFDMNYNWGLYELLLSLAHDSKNAQYVKYYIPEDYPEGTFKLNFLDNHDKNSYEHTIMEGFGREALPEFFTLIYTMPGMPLIYSGDEIGLDHAIAFMEKDTIDWSSPDVSYRELLKELAQIRSDNQALYAGAYGGDIEYYDTGERNVLAFSRTKEDNKIKCIFNMSKREKSISVSGIADDNDTVLINGAEGESFTEDCPIDEYVKNPDNLTLKPWGYVIIKD